MSFNVIISVPAFRLSHRSSRKTSCNQDLCLQLGSALSFRPSNPLIHLSALNILRIKPHCGSMTFSIGIANTFVYKHDKRQSFVTYRKKSWKKKTIIRRLPRRLERLGAPFHSLWNYGSCNVFVAFKHLKSKKKESIRIRLHKEGLINSLCATTSNTPMRNHD